MIPHDMRFLRQTFLVFGLLFVLAARGRRLVSARRIVLLLLSIDSTATTLFTVTIGAIIAFFLDVAFGCTKGLGRLITLNDRRSSRGREVADPRSAQHTAEGTAASETAPAETTSSKRRGG